MTATALPSRPALLVVLAACALLAGCGEDEPDAYGTFEAREVVVSAEASGTLLRFEADEGERLLAGAVVGQIDTAGLALQRQELLASQRASRTRTTEARAQIGVLQAQLATAREELARTQRLFQAQAATARQRNQAEGEVRVLEERIEVARAGVAVVEAEAAGVQARLDRITEEIDRGRITNPVGGTVLTTWVEAGEFVQPGTPLYEIADLDVLTLRAWVSGAQLAGLRIGQGVQVRLDAGEDALMTVPGRVTWIASEAEFTPTPIQTREERTDQVYAVEIRVPNQDGAIKIGMPGEVLFAPGEEGGSPQAATPERPPRERLRS